MNVTPSPLAQGRGLKQCWLLILPVIILVAPRTGAWIETLAGNWSGLNQPSPLAQGRGLKPATGGDQGG